MSRMLRFASEEDLKKHLGSRAAPARKVSPLDERQSKFHAQATVVDGVKCDSRKEAGHYMLLRERQARHEIRNLVHQGRVALEVKGMLIGHFEPDFLYEAPAVNGDGKWRLHAEDVKGFKRGPAFELYRWKARLFEALHGTTVREI